MNSKIKELNNILSQYGKGDGILGPKYQLVWSDSLTEKRFLYEEYEDQYGDICTRLTKKWKELPKYNYISERWVLEMFIPGIYSANPEVLGSEFGSYEPIFVFEDKHGNFLPPVESVLKRIIFNIENPEKARTAAQIHSEMMEKEDKEIQDFIDMIDVTEVSNALRMGEGVGYSKELKNSHLKGVN